jgi:hypothetical protein
VRRDDGHPDPVRGIVIGDMAARTGPSRDWWRLWIADRSWA